MFEHNRRQRSWGFRFSAADAGVICAVALGAVALNRMENPLWWILMIVVGHFFLFCNMFRVRRKFEFAWTLLFIINVVVWLFGGNLEWTKVLVCQFPVTAVVMVLELRSARYHGIYARRINSRLNDYLEQRIS